MLTEIYKNVFDQIRPDDRVLGEVREAYLAREAPKRGRRRAGVRAVLIAAVVTTLGITTALAYGGVIKGVIKEFAFGDAYARRIAQAPDNPSSETAVTPFTVVHETVEVRSGSNSNRTQYDTLDAMEDAYPFHIKTPGYLPKNVTGLSAATGWSSAGLYTAYGIYTVQLSYSVETSPVSDLHSGYGKITLFQYCSYGGQIDYRVVTSLAIDKVIVGDCEALLMTEERIVDGRKVEGYSLQWTEDNIKYVMYNGYYDEIGVDELIKIAESLA